MRTVGLLMVVSILYVSTVNQMVIFEQHHLHFIINDRRILFCVLKLKLIALL